MKRRALLRHLRKHGCQLDREGKRHSVYRNPQSGRVSTVPRHTEIKERLADKICDDLGIPQLGHVEEEQR